MTVTLLGPQRRPTVDRVARNLPDGPIATINAGWLDREPDDGELDALLGSRSVNLALYRRWLHVQEDDPEFGAAQLQLRESLDEVQRMYLARVDYALGAVAALQRGTPSQRRADEIENAIGAVRALDERHVAVVDEIHIEFDDRWRPQERPVVAGHRQQVADAVRAAVALVIAGGHVGMLSAVLRLFDVTAAPESPVIAWSAGAMALTDRIVLFHDRTSQGPTPPEILGPGRCLVSGIVALPHPRTRLLVDDADRISVFARRFAPARCVLLDPGTRITLDGPPDLPEGARVLAEDGSIRTLEAS